MAHRPTHRGAQLRPVSAVIRPRLVMLALAALLLPFALTISTATPGATQDGANWIQYRIGGHATEEHEEKDVVMCSFIGDGDEFAFRSLGEWVIGVESPSKSFGEHQARFELSPPQGKYGDGDPSTDDRGWGDGTLVLEDGGKDAMGFTVVKGTFAIATLDAASGFSFTLEGSFSCQVL